jgi:hypothetical protein
MQEIGPRRRAALVALSDGQLLPVGVHVSWCVDVAAGTWHGNLARSCHAMDAGVDRAWRCWTIAGEIEQAVIPPSLQCCPTRDRDCTIRPVSMLVQATVPLFLVLAARCVAWVYCCCWHLDRWYASQGYLPNCST